MRKFLSFTVSALVFTILFYLAAIHFYSFKPSYPIYEIEKGWTVTYHSKQYINTNLESLSNEVGTTFERGDVITLTLKDPIAHNNVPFPYLFFKTQFCTYEVYLDDVLLATSKPDVSDIRSFVGISYNFITLPKDNEGKWLSIKLHVTENNTRADIINPMIGNYDDLYRTLLSQALFPFMTGCFLLVFGVVFLVTSLLFSMNTTGATTQILCSCLTAVLGIWMLTSFNFFDFIMNSKISTTIEFCSMYLITPFIYLIVYDLHRRFSNKLLMIMGAATWGFSLLFMLLHFLNKTHITHFQKPYYLISFMGIALLFYYDYIDIRSKQKSSSHRITMLGISVLALSLIIYAVVALLNRVVDYRQSTFLVMVIPVGSIFFVITQLLNYFVFMTRSFAQKKEYAALTRIAYNDSLTGLANRVRCEEELITFDKSEDDFCILSLDLNGLKEVNDNSGHPVGDRLLKSFAGALSSTFEDVGLCARIGGDEFLVLIKTIEKEEIDKRLKLLDEKLLVLDQEDQEINHSVSYGYAYRSETKEKDTHTVFMLADKRMYSFKKTHYAHMMGRE